GCGVGSVEHVVSGCELGRHRSRRDEDLRRCLRRHRRAGRGQGQDADAGRPAGGGRRHGGGGAGPRPGRRPGRGGRRRARRHRPRGRDGAPGPQPPRLDGALRGGRGVVGGPGRRAGGGRQRRQRRDTGRAPARRRERRRERARRVRRDGRRRRPHRRRRAAARSDGGGRGDRPHGRAPGRAAVRLRRPGSPRGLRRPGGHGAPGPRPRTQGPRHVARRPRPRPADDVGGVRQGPGGRRRGGAGADRRRRRGPRRGHRLGGGTARRPPGRGRRRAGRPARSAVRGPGRAGLPGRRVSPQPRPADRPRRPQRSGRIDRGGPDGRRHPGAREGEEMKPEGPARYLDRELSWLDFNGRVLALAEDRALPLLERVKFLAIFSRNLDEFFMIRVAGLLDRVAAGLGAAAIGGLDPGAELASIRKRTEELVLRHTDVCRDEVLPRLADEGIRLLDWQALEKPHRKELGRYFEEQIFPVLTPLSVDPGHPFPYISNLSLNLAIMVRDPERDERRFARVKVPPLLPRFVKTQDGTCFVPLEQVIAAHLDRLFPGMEIELHCPFRVTRNADLSVADEESDDLLATIEMELRRRRFGHAIRLEVNPGMPAEIRELLVRELDLTPENVYEIDGLLNLDSLWQLYGTDRSDLKDTPWPSVVP